MSLPDIPELPSDPTWDQRLLHAVALMVRGLVGAEPPAPAPEPEPPPVPAPPAPAPVPAPPPPAPEPPPAPVPPPTAGHPPQGWTHDGAMFGDRGDSDAPCGAPFGVAGARALWNKRLSLRFRRGSMGDWIDALGAENGAVPFATTPIVAGQVAVSVDLTALARRWQSDNRGAYIAATGTDFPFVFAGRSSATPPVLRVRMADGAEHELTPRANASWSRATAAVTSSSAAWAVQRNQGAAILQWGAIPAGEIVTATLLVTCTRADRAGGLAVFAADPPTFFIPSERNPESRPGLRAEVGSFAALADHPDALLTADGAEGGRLDRGLRFARRIVDGPDGPEIESGWEAPSAGKPDTRTSADNRIDIVRGVLEDEGASAPGLRGFVPEVVRDEQHVQIAFSLGPDYGSSSDWCKVFGLMCQWGYWNRAGYWQPLVGNGGGRSDGRKVWHTPNNGQPATWIYNGPSIRFLIGQPGLEDGPYRDLFPACDYVYTVDQAGPFPPGVAFDGVLLRKGDRYVWDIELRQNSIAEPFDSLGNGQGVRDGVLRVEINGWKVHERTDLMLRRHPQMGTHGFWLDCFHGGASSPSRDMPHAYTVGALAIATRHIGV